LPKKLEDGGLISVEGFEEFFLGKKKFEEDFYFVFFISSHGVIRFTDGRPRTCRLKHISPEILSRMEAKNFKNQAWSILPPLP